jgi:hypothetical protein
MANVLLMVAEYDAVSLVVIKAPEIRQLRSVALMAGGRGATNRGVQRVRQIIKRANVLLMEVEFVVQVVLTGSTGGMGVASMTGIALRVSSDCIPTIHEAR